MSDISLESEATWRWNELGFISKGEYVVAGKKIKKNKKTQQASRFFIVHLHHAALSEVLTLSSPFHHTSPCVAFIHPHRCSFAFNPVSLRKEEGKKTTTSFFEKTKQKTSQKHWIKEQEISFTACDRRQRGVTLTKLFAECLPVIQSGLVFLASFFCFFSSLYSGTFYIIIMSLHCTPQGYTKAFLLLPAHSFFIGPAC